MGDRRWDSLLRAVPAGRAAFLLLFVTMGAAAACSEGEGPTGQDEAALAQALAAGGAPGVTVSSSVVTVGVGGSSGVGGGGGIGGGTGGGAAPVGFWKFDDCSASSTSLADASGAGNTAMRTASVACAPGIDGLAVVFDQGKDDVTVADSASFAFTDHVAVAAWVHPTAVSGTQTIATQEASGKQSFALSITKGRVQFSVTLKGNKTVTSSAPITANAWHHVAGTYDGQFVFLFLDGQQVGQVDFPGILKDVSGPIHIGNDSSKQTFKGAIDDVWISTDPVSGGDIAQLACVRRPPTVVATPQDGPPSPPDTSVDYSVVLTNNDAGFCAPSSYFFSANLPSGFTSPNAFAFEPSVAPGASVTFPLSVTGGEDPAPGIHTIPFIIQNFSSFDPPITGQVTYDLLAPTGCFVSTSRELMIKDLSVVEDPIRTTFNGPAGDPRTGAWTFAALMQNLAPTPGDAPALVRQMLGTWLTSQQVGGFTVPARPSLQQLVIDPWPKLPNGDLDLTRAPLRLSAIVNRMDVRNLDQGKAGEGRFVFSVLDPNGFPLQFTLIVEYALPATTDADVLSWANAWHALSSHPFPSEEYNAALQALTTQFTGRGAAPGQPNGSALAQLRTNEIALAPEWELREFHLSPATGLLQPSGVALTPDLSLDGTSLVADYVNQNEATILTQHHTVPTTFEGQPFLGGSSLNPIAFWSAPGIADNDARQLFSLNTCNGCHGAETGTGFLHIAPRFAGQESQLSGFLTGITVPDPVSGVPRTFNDLAARKQDLSGLVCPPPASPATAAARSAFIARGARRVH